MNGNVIVVGEKVLNKCTLVFGSNVFNAVIQSTYCYCALLLNGIW